MAKLDPQTLYHRTLDGWLAKLPYADYEVRKEVFDEAAKKTGMTLGTAHVIRERKLMPILYVAKKDQDFKSYATKWEIFHSKLAFGAGSGKAEPIVDENMTVLGHLNWFDRDYIYVPAKEAIVTRKGWHEYVPPSRPLLNRLFEDEKPRNAEWEQVEHLRDLEALLVDGVEVYADASQVTYLSRGYVQPLPQQTSYRVATDPEGRALFVTEVHDRETVEPNWVTPLDIFSIVKLVALAGSAIISMVAVRVLARAVAVRTMRNAVRKLGSGVAGELTSGAASEGTSAASRELTGGATRRLTSGAAREGAGDAARAAGARTGNTLRGIGAAVARGIFRRRVGPMTVEEMHAYLRELLAARPDLRRLMAARVMTGQGRMDAINIALKEFERTQGWTVVEKTAAEMEAVTSRGNIVTMRAQAKELWINAERANRWDPEQFYNHVVHDLAAHALAGRGGTLGAAHLPFIGSEFSQGANGLFILEEVVKRGDLDGVMASYY